MMKKLLTLLFLAVGFLSNAQGIEFMDKPLYTGNTDSVYAVVTYQIGQAKLVRRVNIGYYLQRKDSNVFYTTKAQYKKGMDSLQQIIATINSSFANYVTKAKHTTDSGALKALIDGHTASIATINSSLNVANWNTAFEPANPNIQSHIANTANPHSVTKTQVGLANVPNVDATARANHTGTQAASTITEDATHRFATDAEKTIWNAKQAAITLTTVGTSGAATLTGGTLNIPNYIAILPTGWVKLEDYGAIGDSLMMNTVAFRNAIAALPAKGGVILISPGIFKINVDSIIVNKSVTFMGSGGSAFTYGPMTAPTKIITNASTGKAFDITANNVQFKDLMLDNVSGTSATAGAGIYLTNCVGFKLINAHINGFYNGVDFDNGYSWLITGSTISGFSNYGVRVRDNAIPDENDGNIIGCHIYPKLRNAVAAIKQESGGGLKVNNVKFNNDKLVDGGSYYFQYCYLGDFQVSPTLDLQFVNCSFENYTAAGIKMIPNNTFYGNIIVTGNQFASYYANTTDIDFSTGLLRNVTVAGNTFLGSFMSGCRVIRDEAMSAGGYVFDANSWLQYSAAQPNISQTVSQNNPLKLTTTGTSGAATLDANTNTINIPQYPAGAVTSLTTTGTSGAATLSSGVLNIPQYSGGSGSGGDLLSTLLNSEVSVTAGATLTSSAFGKMHVCTGTSADYTINLPAAAGNAGKLIGFRMSNALTKLVTLDPNASETIDGATTRTLWKDEVAILLCDGTTWTKIAGKSIAMVCVVAQAADKTVAGNFIRVALDLDVIVTDPAGMASTSNSRIYIRRSGNYLITPVVRYNATSGGDGLPTNISRLLSFVSKDGGTSDYLHQGETAGLQGAYPFASIPSVSAYTAGSYLRLMALTNYTSNLVAKGSGTTENSFLSVEEKLSW